MWFFTRRYPRCSTLYTIAYVFPVVVSIITALMLGRSVLLFAMSTILILLMLDVIIASVIAIDDDRVEWLLNTMNLIESEDNEIDVGI